MVGLREELDRSDDHLEVIFLVEQVVDDLWYFLDLAQLLGDILNAQHLTVLVELLLLPSDTQVEPVGLLVKRNQEDHGAFVLLLHLQQISNKHPIAVYVHSELLLRHEVDLVAGVFVEEGVSIAQVAALQHRQVFFCGSLDGF